MKKEFEKATKFLLVFLAIYVLIYYILILWNANLLIGITEAISKFLLGLFYPITERGTFFLVKELPITISMLCTGMMELSVLLAAILATREIKLEKRLLGALIAIPTVLVINQLRILFTVFSYFWFGFSALDFAHNFLFRLSLFAIIVGYYIVWTLWVVKLTGKKETNKKKTNLKNMW